MKSLRSIAILFALISSHIAQAQGFAPDSISNLAFAAAISGGTAPYASSGTFAEVFANNGTFYIVDLSGNILPAFGTYTYTKTGPNSATIQESFAANYLPDTTYTATFTSGIGGNFTGSETSLAVVMQSGVFALTPFSTSAPLINISARGTLSSGQNLNPGFVIGGTVPRTVLIRAIGPGLIPFGVINAIQHTTLTVYSGQQPIASNTGWSSDSTQVSTLAQTFVNVGAFSLQIGSADSAIILTLNPGPYTAIAEGTSSADSGSMLVEVYFVQ